MCEKLLKKYLQNQSINHYIHYFSFRLLRSASCSCRSAPNFSYFFLLGSVVKANDWNKTDLFGTLVQIPVVKNIIPLYHLFIFSCFVFNLKDVSILNMHVLVYMQFLEPSWPNVWSYLRYPFVSHAHAGLLYYSLEVIMVLKLYSSSFCPTFSITFTRFIYDYKYILQWFIFYWIIRSFTPLFIFLTTILYINIYEVKTVLSDNCVICFTLLFDNDFHSYWTILYVIYTA